jgi:hypothetical protein
MISIGSSKLDTQDDIESVWDEALNFLDSISELGPFHWSEALSKSLRYILNTVGPCQQVENLLNDEANYGDARDKWIESSDHIYIHCSMIHNDTTPPDHVLGPL